MYIDWILLSLVGLLAGTISGLLGIGGGVVLVPSLFFLMHYLSIPPATLMHTVIATSLAAMVFTTFSSTMLHIKAAHIKKDLILWTAPGIVLGSILGAYIAHFISHNALVVFFSIFLFFISVRFFLNFQIELPMPKTFHLTPFGSIIGFVSSLLGIGGGVIALPLYSSFNISLKYAIGCSAFATFLTSTIGSISYAIIGWMHHIHMAKSIGYVYIPAFIIVGLSMLITTPIGVKLSEKFSAKLLRKIFAIILLITSISMLVYNF